MFLKQENATKIRNNFSLFIDKAVREKPIFFKRNRDSVSAMNINFLKEILMAYNFNAVLLQEEDNSITLSLNELDIAVNGTNKQEAIDSLINDIIEYAKDYLEDFEYWHSGNRKQHLPYVLKVLTCDRDEVKGLITCQSGEN